MTAIAPDNLAITLASAADAEPDVFALLDTYAWAFIAAFIAAFAITPVMRWLALRNNVVDTPDLKRKMHLEPIAYLGGVGIFLGWLAGMLACLFLTRGGVEGGTVTVFPETILIGATVIVFVGVFDDIYGVSPRIKIGGQLIAAAALASERILVGEQQIMLGEKLVADTFGALGIATPELAVLGMGLPYLYILGTVAIAIFVIGGCNAMNLIDGLDGLATGVTSIAVIGFLMISITVAQQTFAGGTVGDSYDAARIALCLALLGALLGFLPYNFNPAVIFMGDAGSLLLGFLCVSIILQFERIPGRGPFYVMAGLIVFALPIIDTTLAIVRRKMRGQSMSEPDSQHIHHQLLRAARRSGLGPGTSVKLAVIAMYGMAAIFAALGYAMAHYPWRYLLAVFLVLFGTIAVTAYKSAHRQILMEQLKKEGRTPPADAPGLADNADSGESQDGDPAAPADHAEPSRSPAGGESAA